MWNEDEGDDDLLDFLSFLDFERNRLVIDDLETGIATGLNGGDDGVEHAVLCRRICIF